jgi:hypothetical protein
VRRVVEFQLLQRRSSSRKQWIAFAPRIDRCSSDHFWFANLVMEEHIGVEALERGDHHDGH